MHKKAKEKSFNLDFFEKRRPYRTLFIGGWGEIRTPGGSPLNGFQDRRIKPLCHPSAKSSRSFKIGTSKTVVLDDVQNGVV